MAGIGDMTMRQQIRELAGPRAPRLFKSHQLPATRLVSPRSTRGPGVARRPSALPGLRSRAGSVSWPLLFSWYSVLALSVPTVTDTASGIAPRASGVEISSLLTEARRNYEHNLNKRRCTIYARVGDSSAEQWQQSQLQLERWTKHEFRASGGQVILST